MKSCSPAVALPVAELDAYVGRYRAGPDLVFIHGHDFVDVFLDDRKSYFAGAANSEKVTTAETGFPGRPNTSVPRARKTASQAVARSGRYP